jgi:hypothetical protein
MLMYKERFVPLSIHVPPAARCLEGSQRGVMAGPSSPTVLIVVRVLSAWRAHRRPEGPSHGVCCRGEALGEKSIGGGGATLVADGIPLGPCRPVLAWGGLGVESERRNGRTPPAMAYTSSRRWYNLSSSLAVSEKVVALATVASARPHRL